MTLSEYCMQRCPIHYKMTLSEYCMQRCPMHDNITLSANAATCNGVLYDEHHTEVNIASLNNSLLSFHKCAAWKKRGLRLLRLLLIVGIILLFNTRHHQPSFGISNVNHLSPKCLHQERGSIVVAIHSVHKKDRGHFSNNFSQMPMRTKCLSINMNRGIGFWTGDRKDMAHH